MIESTIINADCKRMPSPRRKTQRQISLILRTVVFCWIPLLCVSSGVCANSEYKTSSDSSNTSNTNNSCRLYMAPTTMGGIKGNYGMFTSVDLPTGASILANDGPNIPVIVDDRKTSKIFPDTDHMGLFDNVWWGLASRTSDQFRNGEFNYGESSAFNMVDLQINFGALPNCHPYRSNLDVLQPADGIDYDDRSYLSENHVNNPLRGSFSYYTGKNFFVDKPVEAGTELFLDYEGDWEQHGFPREQDYFSAAALGRKWILAALEKEEDDESCTNGNKNDPNTILPTDDLVNGAKALLKLTRIVSPESKLDRLGYDSFSYDDYEDTIDNGIYQLEQLTSRVLSLLPQTTDDWNKIYKRSWEIYFDRKTKIDPPPEKSIPDFPSIMDVADAMYDVSKPPPKSIQELRETGICLDHIVAGSSKAPLETETATGQNIDSSNNMTIGRGAIAARFLPKGELIVPVPLLHLLDRSLFEKLPQYIFSHEEENEDSFEEQILNYCFGHSQSTLVMCPITNAVLINHCSDRIGRFPCGSGGNGPNAEYRWASDSEWDIKTKETLTMTLDELGGTNHQQQHRMMSMEIVATRDIEEGEEVRTLLKSECWGALV